MPVVGDADEGQDGRPRPWTLEERQAYSDGLARFGPGCSTSTRRTPLRDLGFSRLLGALALTRVLLLLLLLLLLLCIVYPFSCV
jgi:hypothetical protein